MGLDKEIAVQRAKILSHEKHTTDLLTRWEDDYDLLTLEKYQIPAEEGEWENYTTNSPATLGYSIMGALGEARRKLWIPQSDEKSKERDALSKTEQLAIGAIQMADWEIIQIPEAIDIQSELSFYSPIRGWCILRCYLEEDGGKLKVHIAAWDPLNTQWIAGKNGASWVNYQRFATLAQLKDEYGNDKITASEDSQGRILVNNAFDETETGTWVGDKWVDGPKEHGQDHVPVLILPVGSIPFIQSQRRTNTIKDLGESIYAKNRHIYPIESRLHSYELTRAGQSAKMPTVVEYDSSKAPLPPEIEKDPYVKGRTILLDAAKGQTLKKFLEQPSNQDILQMQAFTANQVSMGGMAPIAFGQNNQAIPAAGIDMLTDSARQTLKPYKKNIEMCFAWLAEEIVRQYKNGDYKANVFEGDDKSGKRFHAEIEPKDIEDNWHFQCELKLNLLRDEVGKMGLAVQSTKAGILSKQTAREKYADVDDTNLEQGIIDREDAELITQKKAWDMARALFEDGDKTGAQIIINTIMAGAGISPSGPTGGPASTAEAEIAARQSTTKGNLAEQAQNLSSRRA